MQLNLFKEESNKTLLHDLFIAYYEPRKNKRNTINALKFEINYERIYFNFMRKSLQENIKSNPVFVL